MERFFLDCAQLFRFIADNHYNMATDRRLSIRVSPEVASQVQKTVLDWLKIYDVASTSPIKPKLLFAGEKYLDIQAVKERLDAILADGRVDPLESYGLYKAVAQAAGPDATLQDSEVSGIEIRSLRVIMGLDPSLKELSDIDLLSLAAVPINSFQKPFEDSDIVRKQTVAMLDEVDTGLSIIITMTQEIYSQQKERETSYFNFVSAENGWGISSWFTPGHEPPSVARMRGTYQFLRELQDHQVGLDVLRASIPLGIFPEDNPYVKKFFNGPFPLSIALREFLVEGETRRSDARTIGFARQLVGLAMACGAEDMAVLLAKVAQNGSPDVQIPFDGILPPATARFVSGSLTDFANSSLSLHHMLVYSTSAVFGKLLAARFSAAPAGLGMTVARQGTQFNLSHFALPGLRVFGSAAAGESWLGLKGLRVLGNFGAECVKWGGYTASGHAMAGYSGLQVGSMAYIGLLGGVTGWLSGKLATVGAELAGGGDGNLLGGVLASGASESGIWRLVRGATQAANMRSFRLVPRIPEEGVAVQVRALIRDISKSVRTQDMARRQLEKLVRRAEELAVRHPERLGESFLERVRKLAENPDPVVAAREVRAAIATGESAASVLPTIGRRPSRSRITVASPSQRDVSLSKRFREVRDPTPPDGNKKIPWRKGRPGDSAAEGNAAPAKPPQPSTTPAPASPAELVLSSPPEVLTEEIVATLGRGRVQFTTSAWKEAVNLYGSSTFERGAFLRRLKELGEANGSMGNAWTSIRTAGGCFRGRVGIHHRMLVQRVGRDLRIYRVAPRRELVPRGSWQPPPL